MIEILNVKPGDVFHNSIVLLHGLCNDKNPNNIQCFDSNGSVSNWSVINNQFKVFVHLIFGRNEITLKTNETQLKIILFRRLVKSERIVRVLYIVCQDDCSNGQFQSNDNNNDQKNALNRIHLNVRLLQTFLSEAILKQFKIRKTFFLKCDADLEEICSCEIFRTKLKISEALSISSNEIFTYLLNEINKNFNSDEKFIAILSFTRYFPEKIGTIFQKTKGYCALAAQNLAVYGTACLFTWAENLSDLENKIYDQNQVDSNYMNDSAFRNTYSDCYSTTLGSLLHEMSHLFDLGHNFEGIMHRGFDDLKNFISIQTNECFCYENFRLAKALNGEIDRISVFKSQEILDNEKTYIEKKIAHFKSNCEKQTIFYQKSLNFYLSSSTKRKSQCECLKNCYYTFSNLMIFFYNKFFNETQNCGGQIKFIKISNKLFNVLSDNRLIWYQLGTSKRNLEFDSGDPCNSKNDLISLKLKEHSNYEYLLEFNLSNLLKRLLEINETRDGCNNLSQIKHSSVDSIALFLMDDNGLIFRENISVK
ncbi:zinc metallo ase [Brachionus plicatilis]|uniref:Zinc metallo ase n=1 Tax=Brachionus plicatilis TaxID=10195 RepID=A0A3M7Q953_BRAPC|nr:zinc metallo ase [Brachionus plicatilis]